MASIQSADLIKERALIQRLRYLRDSFSTIYTLLMLKFLYDES